MRKLYALLTGLLMSLVSIPAHAKTVTPDVANFTITINAPGNNVAFTNTSVLGNEPGTRKAHWFFGDGTIEITPPLQSTQHHYASSGTYTVCLKIYRYYSNTNDSVLSAQICKTLVIEAADSCTANFIKLPPTTVTNPLQAAFQALPWHNNNKRPIRICWQFGDGPDTCIYYTNTNPGPYIVHHNYEHPGVYEVCVKINYHGGCEARKCDNIRIGRPDTCTADFERLPPTSANNPLRVTLKALPHHNNNRKPSRICWTFGDGKDTCINYLNIYNGQYTVSHTYQHPGLYEVCVKILYFGGCEARKCKALQVGRPDTCRADFERIPSNVNNPRLAYFRALPQHNNNRKPARICWTFGDNRDTCINYPENYTGSYVVSHRYEHSGQYEVCVKIFYYGGCEARKCKNIVIGEPDHCTADFERYQSPTASPLTVGLIAVPWNSNNRKPARICWDFGDGRDTCINYPENYTGQYTVVHHYEHPGPYEVCVKIFYYGGCEARKCKNIQVGEPATCTANFERYQSPTASPLTVGLIAVPWNSNNRKPARICWDFGDGRDTCINYPENYSGQYTVIHHYEHSGQYEVCVKILYYGGCEARKCRNIQVPATPANCTVHLFEITPSITSLVRGFFAYPVTSVPNSRPERICWYFGDGDDTCIMLNPQNTNPLNDYFIRHTYPGPGVYRVCVKVRFQGGCIAEDCREVVIRAASNTCGGFMIDSLIAPRSYKFKGFSIHAPNDEPLFFRWNFGDGSPVVFGREVTHTYDHGGDYEVCLTIKTRLGCETRICKTVRVPGNNQPALHLTPNPVINVMHVEFFSTHTETINIKILNSMGVQVRNYSRSVIVGPNSWNVDLATLMPGVYSFIIQSPNQLASAIFIKQ